MPIRILSILVICLASVSCSEVIFDKNESAREETFEKQKGRMRPVSGFYETYVGCPGSVHGFYSCCFSQHTQTYLSKDHLVARAVADGTVARVVTIEPRRGAVVIKHGDYLSVFSNLERMVVKEGQEIRLGDIIGEGGLDYTQAHRELKFELYHKIESLHPKDWLLN